MKWRSTECRRRTVATYIMPEYENNTINYSVDGGTKWETIIFVNGMYSYTDLDDYIHEFMRQSDLWNKLDTCFVNG